MEKEDVVGGAAAGASFSPSSGSFGCSMVSIRMCGSWCSRSHGLVVEERKGPRCERWLDLRDQGSA